MNCSRSSARFALAALATLLILSITGCATTYVKPSGTTNAAPAEPLSAFQHFELQRISMGSPYAGQSANERALRKIQENFDERVGVLVKLWNAKAPDADTGLTLVIIPHIQDIKFISGGTRFWTGAMSGSSAVVLKLKLVDKATGNVVATPEFYQRAAAMSGAWTMGGTDNNMLIRITEITEHYLSANYDKAVGGPTGLPEEDK
ncbi:MAG: hypothetical protein ABI222_14225 [Opitutaceae bacterium]